MTCPGRPAACTPTEPSSDRPANSTRPWLTACTSCNEQRSTLGKGQAGRRLPAVDLVPLDLLADAYAQLTTATKQLKSAVTRARQHRATWAAIARVLGTTRQAAQQRFTPP